MLPRATRIRLATFQAETCFAVNGAAWHTLPSRVREPDRPFRLLLTRESPSPAADGFQRPVLCGREPVSDDSVIAFQLLEPS